MNIFVFAAAYLTIGFALYWLFPDSDWTDLELIMWLFEWPLAVLIGLILAIIDGKNRKKK